MPDISMCHFYICQKNPRLQLHIQEANEFIPKTAE